ncbi:hypothetical protein [Vallitalea guaymasensis]|uniref:hypothetical protein n=1 Tax=Vallitalea guaymasensis TaxID=1185412 RepID=UPI000DE472FD|nr:hypothetical protein [Vallitalea guaymasensis]
MKSIKNILYYTLMGICTVFLMRLIRYGFSDKIISGDFWIDLLIGVSSVFTIFATIRELKNISAKKIN